MFTSYLWEAEKTVILSSNRTGSSHLVDLSDKHPDKLKRLDIKQSNLDESLLELQNKNYTLLLAIKDPTQRRISAVDLIANLYDTTEKNIFYLKGLINQSQRGCYKSALPPYSLRDSHLDWGASVAYHVLKLKGIKVLPLLLTRSDIAWNDHPKFLYPVPYSHYIESGTIPTLSSISKQILGIHSNEFDTGTVKLGEAIHRLDEMGARHILYDTYCSEFRQICCNIEQEPLLTLDKFIEFEQRCHTSIIRQHNSCQHYESSEDLMEYITQKYLSHPEMRNIVNTNGWPGCTVMTMVDKVKEFMLECLN